MNDVLGCFVPLKLATMGPFSTSMLVSQSVLISMLLFVFSCFLPLWYTLAD